MALEGALQGYQPGKKIVHGSVSVTTNVLTDLKAELRSIDRVVICYGTQPAATNAFAHVTWTGTIFNIVCRESDFTTGTTAATIHYVAIGDAPK